MKHNIVSSLNLSSKNNRIVISLPSNKKNIIICKSLFKLGIISSYRVDYNKNKLTISFSYLYEKKSLLLVRQISKPGRKVYMKYSQLFKYLKNRKYLFILSTNKGIISNKEAIRNKIGGEVLFIIQW